jgi:hydroxymethylglutaryl-CoA lyase
MVNLMTGLEYGLDHFDTALGGMGGCPFIPGAAGNIATEDVVHLLTAMGFESGVDGPAVAACSRRLEAFLGRQLPAKMLRVIEHAGPRAEGEAARKG